MSLTILFQTPVDTGRAKIRPKVENPNLKDFYLLTGKLTPVELMLRRSVRGSVHCASSALVNQEAIIKKELLNKFGL